MELLSLDRLAGLVGRLLLVALAVTALESPSHARPWEPIETAFDYDAAAFRNGALVLPNFGLVSGDSDKAPAAMLGYRMDAILGWHLSPRFSLNGELDLSILRFRADTSNGEADTGLLFAYTLSPLFHIGAHNHEFVIGPKLGRFRYSLPDNSYGDELSRSTGWSYGLNVGILAPVQTMAIGGLASYTANHATEICDSTCHARTSSMGDLRVLAVSFAMLY